MNSIIVIANITMMRSSVAGGKPAGYTIDVILETGRIWLAFGQVNK